MEKQAFCPNSKKVPLKRFKSIEIGSSNFKGQSHSEVTSLLLKIQNNINCILDFGKQIHTRICVPYDAFYLPFNPILDDDGRIMIVLHSFLFFIQTVRISRHFLKSMTKL